MAKLQQGIESKNRWIDNVFIERLWRSVKYEEIHCKEYDSVTELIQSLKQHLNFYNFRRPHQVPDRKTPAKLYFGTAATLKGRMNKNETGKRTP